MGVRGTRRASVLVRRKISILSLLWIAISGRGIEIFWQWATGTWPSRPTFRRETEHVRVDVVRFSHDCGVVDELNVQPFGRSEDEKDGSQRRGRNARED